MIHMDQTLVEILRSAMTDLVEQNRKARDLLLSLVDEGSLVQHQTSGALDKMADLLLGTLKQDGKENAD